MHIRQRSRVCHRAVTPAKANRQADRRAARVRACENAPRFRANSANTGAPTSVAGTKVSIPASYPATNPFSFYSKLSPTNSKIGTVMRNMLCSAPAGDMQTKTDGKPVARWYQVPIQFKLPDN
jgi:hypothetical protein